MRNIVIILILTGSLLFTFIARGHAANTELNYLSKLQSLIDREVLFDSQIPIDSIISWSERVLPSFKSKQNADRYFELQYQLIYAYIMRGDISLAIDATHRMYDDAKIMENNLGFAFSTQAIGDIYANTNLKDKAIESFAEAQSKLTHLVYPYKWRFASHLITVLLQRNRPQEAFEYISQLKEVVNKTPDHPIAFLYFIHEITYSLVKSNIARAEIYLQKADSVCHINNEAFNQYIFGYVQASYFRTIGQTDKALAKYDETLRNLPSKPTSSDYRNISAEKIFLYKQLGRMEEASHIYQEQYLVADTIASQSYARQINALKATYQIDQLEIENKSDQNKFIFWIILICIGLFTIISILGIWLKKQNRKVIKSKEELERSKRNAENATRAKSVFLSNMSHEIRTPLNALSGFSALLTQEGLDDATRQQCTEIIQQNSELLLKLINDVIDLSSLEFGKMQFCIENRDAVTICKNVADTVNKVKQTQAEVYFKSSLETLEIATDDSRLQQVLINLLINATKFTPTGSITLELEMQSESIALFSVTDTGCGIPLEKQANIFQRFEKLNENAQGSGLGLSICQLIIEHIGGEIWIDPKYTEGSRFVFTHPIRQIQGQERKEAKI